MGACTATNQPKTNNPPANQGLQPQGQEAQPQPQAQPQASIHSGDAYAYNEGSGVYRIYFNSSDFTVRMECIEGGETSNNAGRYEDLGNLCYKLTLPDGEGGFAEENIIIENNQFSLKGNKFTKVNV